MLNNSSKFYIEEHTIPPCTHRFGIVLNIKMNISFSILLCLFFLLLSFLKHSKQFPLQFLSKSFMKFDLEIVKIEEGCQMHLWISKNVSIETYVPIKCRHASLRVAACPAQNYAFCIFTRPFAAAGHDPCRACPDRGLLHVGRMGDGGSWWACWQGCFGFTGGRSHCNLFPSCSL